MLEVHQPENLASWLWRKGVFPAFIPAPCIAEQELRQFDEDNRVRSHSLDRGRTKSIAIWLKGPLCLFISLEVS